MARERHRGTSNNRTPAFLLRCSDHPNPFVIGRDGTRADVIARYEAWLPEQPELIAALPELASKTLGCWCAPQACHGDVLARLAASAAA